MQTLRNWPWFETLRTLRARFRDDRLGLTASSLTFTTLISLVPLLTVMLAIFTAFPMFGTFQAGLEKYFLQTLVPPNIAKPVLGALTMFATKASRLGAFGLVALGFTAMALMLTIDRTLNAIWRVKKPRPIAQRVLIYWTAVTLGPLILGASLTFTSYAISASSGMVQQMNGGVSFSLSLVEFLAFAAAMSGMYHYVPNTPVAWRHAVAGGVFVAAGMEIARRTLGWYLGHMTSYSSVYGAFATVPIFLLWIYLGWVIVLLGAVIAAYAPSLKLNLVQHRRLPGQRFALALEIVRRLQRSREAGEHGMSGIGPGRQPARGSVALRVGAGGAGGDRLGRSSRRGRPAAPRAAVRSRAHAAGTAGRRAAARADRRARERAREAGHRWNSTGGGASGMSLAQRRLVAACQVLLAAHDERSARMGSYALLDAVGNNHGGTYGPDALLMPAAVVTILGHGSAWACFGAVEALIDLCGSFEPDLDPLDPASATLAPRLRAAAKDLLPTLGELVDGHGAAATSAARLIELLSEPA